MSAAPDRRFDVTLDSLERSAHVPPQEQTEEVGEREQDGSSWAWDEERRQARLAGGA
jgi:hypothetical protein